MIHLHSNGTRRPGQGGHGWSQPPGTEEAGPRAPLTHLLVTLSLANPADIFQVGECRRVQRLAVSPAAGLLVALCGRGPSVHRNMRGYERMCSLSSRNLVGVL